MDCDGDFPGKEIAPMNPYNLTLNLYFEFYGHILEYNEVTDISYTYFQI